MMGQESGTPTMILLTEYLDGMADGVDEEGASEGREVGRFEGCVEG